MTPIRKIQQEHGIVGRDAELGLSLAVLDSGRHLLFEALSASARRPLLWPSAATSAVRLCG